MGLSAKEYLQQLRDIDVSINQDVSRLEAMRSGVMGQGAIRYDRERVQTSPKDKLCSDVCDIVTFNDRIDRRIKKFVDTKELIIEQIRGLHNAVYNQVLFSVYVEYKSLKETACDMGRCYAFVREKHREGLEAFEGIYPDLQYLT